MLVFLSPLGRSAFRLSAGGRSVGWLRGRTVHVGGFGDADDALEAGDAGYLALVRWVARRRGEVFSAPPRLHVAGSDDGSFEWIGRDGTCVGRLVVASDVGGFGVEFTLPDGLLAAVAIGAAAQVWDAILEVQRGASYDMRAGAMQAADGTRNAGAAGALVTDAM